MINIKNVSFGYSPQKYALKNINLHVNRGECILLCGKSGCGKTTMTKLVNGLIPHFTENCHLEGSIVAAGMNVPDTELYELSKKIGSVFQNPKSQFFNIDSVNELAFGLENEGADPELIKKRIKDTVETLKIEGLLNKNIFAMSGGEKQSLAFASVYTMNPDIYVLDEPTANLDENAIDIIKKQIAEIKKQGKTILIADHRLYYLTDLIDRAVYMEDGRILDIFNRREFIGLRDEERIKMGLRTLKKTKAHVAIGDIEEDGQLLVKNLSCTIKDNIIFQNLSFSAKLGDVIGITGSNGVGKTTLMRCLAGLIKESSGNISLDGRRLKPKDRNKLCYMIKQDVNHQLFADSTWNECEISSSNIGDEDIENILRNFDLYGLKDNHPMALSGGQKQRLAIATGVLIDKRILIFDEPTSGLDYDHMIAVSRTIRKLGKDRHIIFIITHDREFLEITCDRAITFFNERMGG